MTAVVSEDTYKERQELTRELGEAIGRLPPPEQAASFAPYLPLFFRLKGQPFTTRHHFPIDSLYARTLPWRLLYKCARQVGKSMNVSASNIVSSATTPHFSTLFVLPRFEQVRRLSSNYVRPLLAESPIRNLLTDSRCEKSVLQKTLVNRSILHFSFALLDCERCRGIAADRCNYDEVQEFDPDFLPIIGETMSASPYAISCYTGTAKTLDNTIETLWQETSMAEWIIPCSCGYHNIPSVDYDAERMLGPVSNIALYGTGLICAKCARPIDAESGGWVPRVPEREPVFMGRHVPQIIVPLHYADERKWAELHYKRDTMLRAVFVNECYGESYDLGVRLVSLSDLHRASKLEWTLDEALTRDFSNRYEMTALGVDWGGGGQSGQSTTAVAVVGRRPDGLLETLYLERFDLNIGDRDERARIYHLYKMFRCDWFAHDFAGAGRVKDTQVRQDQVIAEDRILPFQYVATGARNLVVYHPPTADSFRYYYSYDKTWSLSLLLQLIKSERLVFPKSSPKLDALLADFLALTEEKRERSFLNDVYLIRRGGSAPDDVVHAVNYAAGTLFHVSGKFPDITMDFRSHLGASRALDRELTEKDWEQDGSEPADAND